VISRNKPVYVYLVPKKKWPKKVYTVQMGNGVYMDKSVEQDILGYEFLRAHSVEVDGEEV